ncbi:hypothetical protein [Nonomuraea sp. NPDC049758]|uniref:hypothetical protein n=1 Tax=Nonomuraea sp. NPDC049758 TaxID=3154360 RepID=UPI0034158CD6
MVPRPALSCRALSCRAGGRTITEDLTLAPAPGERVALMGPSAEQDATHRALDLDELLAVTGDGTTLVLATHDPEVAERCDRVIRLRSAVRHHSGSRPCARPRTRPA